MRHLGLMALISIAIVLLFLSANASASATITFTTTANFDAGTKAPMSNGNLGIETTTDNLGIASGSFELGSEKGDSFTTADADANTAKWDLFTLGTCGTNDRSIAAGVLNEDLECILGGYTGVVSSASVDGDWDVRIKLDKTVDIGTTNMWQFDLFSSNLSNCVGVTDDGVAYALIDTTMNAYTCINTAFAQIGSATTIPSDPVWLRITRATDTFTWLYSTDGVAWTTDETTTTASIPNPLFPFIILFADTLNEPTGGIWDDYHLASGSFSSGGYRTTGSWTSAGQTPTSEVFRTITVTYSGASAGSFIGSATLFNGAGTPVFTDVVPVTSGTTKVYTVGDLAASGAWTVRLGLASTLGDGTVNVQSIVVDTVTAPVAPSGCIPPLVSQILSPAIIVLIGAGLLVVILGALLSTKESFEIGKSLPLIIGVILTVVVTALLIPLIMNTLAAGAC